MKKMADKMSKAVKWLLVFGFVFSQVSFPLEVLADELTNEYDQETILDGIILGNYTSDYDLNNDGVLNILDATHSTFIDVPEVEVVDVLTNSLDVSAEEVLVGDTVEVNLFISGFEQLSLHGIEGLLSYDEEVLKLVGASLHEVTNEENDGTTGEGTDGTTGEGTDGTTGEGTDGTAGEGTDGTTGEGTDGTTGEGTDGTTGEGTDGTTGEGTDGTTGEGTDGTTGEGTDGTVENLGYLDLETGKFAYVLGEGFNEEEVALLTLTFETIAVGTSAVTVSDIMLSYGEAFEVTNDTVSVDVVVSEDGVGGDVEDGEQTPDEDNNSSDKEEEKEETEVVVKPVALSSDYYIKNLSIDGYEIDFDMYRYDYSITVDSDVSSLDFEVLLNNSNSIYYVEGNENFKEGENLVYLVVKAENGSTKTYTVKVLKEKQKVVQEKTEIDEDEVEVEEAVSTSKTIIIILIILVIIGLIYVIFKDDEEDKLQVKKESQPEKVKSEKTEVQNAKVETVKITEVKKKSTNNKNNSKSTKKNNKK